MSTVNMNSSDVIDAAGLVDANPKSGRVVWDERGNSTWEWQTRPGVFTRDIEPEQLLKLEASHLRLVESPPQNKFEGCWHHHSERAVFNGDARRHAERKLAKAPAATHLARPRRTA
jgi:hypothetical protein